MINGVKMRQCEIGECVIMRLLRNGEVDGMRQCYKNHLLQCIADVRTWMINNILKINYRKPEFLILKYSLNKSDFCKLFLAVGL